MQTKKWTTIDKSEWGEGAWMNEPDKVQFESHGLPCLLHRGPGGHWCGYVGVAEGHSYFKKGYDDVPVDVHGGLTFADFCADTKDESSGICHVPAEGEPHRVWWLGFDCAHLGDASPAYRRYYHYRDESYKTIKYVRRETVKLAKQLTTA